MAIAIAAHHPFKLFRGIILPIANTFIIILCLSIISLRHISSHSLVVKPIIKAPFPSTRIRFCCRSYYYHINTSLFLTGLKQTNPSPSPSTNRSKRSTRTTNFHSSLHSNGSRCTSTRTGINIKNIKMSMKNENNNNNGGINTCANTTTSSESFSSYLNSVRSKQLQIFFLKKNNSEKRNMNKNLNLNIIMGNEAGDADSIISSLALSYVKTMSGENGENGENDVDGSGTCSGEDSLEDILHLPVISINKEDMSLRRDVVLLLQMAGIYNHDELVYLDDPTFVSMIADVNANEHDFDVDKSSITLVDHNKIRSSLMHLEQYVHAIIDHHQDEGCHTESTTTSTREIAFEDQQATVGSTCTLVTEHLILMYQQQQQQQQQLASSISESISEEQRQLLHIDAGLSLALLGVILLDTMNMNSDAGKGTERDEKAINFLIENTDWNALFALGKNEARDGILIENDNNNNDNNDNDGEEGLVLPVRVGVPVQVKLQPDRVRLFEFLQNSKFDKTFWNDMNARDALRIDYKRFEPILSLSPSGSETKQQPFGLSSVLLDANDMLSKKDFHKTAIEYIQDMEIHFLGVLCMVIVDDKPERELILIGKREKLVDLTNHLLTDASTAFLDISLIEDDVWAIMDDGSMDSFVVKRFRQGNPKGSRKQIAPVMLSFFSS